VINAYRVLIGKVQRNSVTGLLLNEQTVLKLKL